MEEYTCSDLDMVLAKCVDEIWETYDVDCSGELDKEETHRFVKHTLAGVIDEDQDEAIEHVFNEFDEDGSGLIDRKEMILFIKKVSGLEADQ